MRSSVLSEVEGRSERQRGWGLMNGLIIKPITLLIISTTSVILSEVKGRVDFSYKQAPGSCWDGR